MRLTKAKRTAVLISATALVWTTYGTKQQEQSKGDVPDDIAYAANFLRSQGMDDPSHGVYQEAVIAYPDISSLLMRERTIHGWVFPARSSGTQKVLAWNGLTYDAISLGEAADLLDDVNKNRSIPSRVFPMGRTIEFIALMDIAGPVPSCLLAMLGEGNLAKEVSERATRTRRNSDIRRSAVSHYDSILSDAVMARIAIAEDFDALLLARKLRRLRQVKGKYPPFAGMRSLSTHESELWYVDKWIADVTRRLANRREDPLTLEEISLLAKEDQIPLLIDLLDEEQRFIIFPGATDTRLTAIGMLKEIGDAATDGLIASLGDQRMTRLTDGSYTFSSPYRFKTVSEICGVMIRELWRLSGFEQADYKFDAEKIRRLWEATSELTNEERWLVALQDDEMPFSVWQSAARTLGHPNYPDTRGTNAANSDHTLPIGPVIPWEHLYNTRRDEVASALLKRAEQGFKPLYVRSDGTATPNYSGASTYAIAAAAWDIDAALPILKRILEAQFSDMQRESVEFVSTTPFPTVASALIYGGEDVWDIYEHMLGQLDFSRSLNLESLLKPIWQHPDHPRSKQLAEKLFLSDGPWHARNSIGPIRGSTSIMLYHPAYLKSVYEALEDTRISSLATRTSKSRIRVNVRRRISSFLNQDSDTLKNVGDTLGLRYCDIVVQGLSRTFDLRDYNLFLPLEKKDEFVTKIKEFIDSGADWTTVQEDRRPLTRGFDPLFYSAPIWPDYSKKD